MCLPKTKGRSSSAQPMASSTKSLLEKYFYSENLKVQKEIQFDGKQRWKSMINTYERKCTFCVRLCTKYLKSRDYLSLCGKEANECSYSVLTNSFVTDSNPEFDSVFDSRQYFSYWIEPFFFCQIQNFSFSSIKTKANRTFNDIKESLIKTFRFEINDQGVSDNLTLQYRPWLSAKSHSKYIFHCQIVILCKIKKWVNCISFRT